MLGGAILREALAAIRQLDLPTDAETDVLAVLEAGRPALPFINEAAYESGLASEVRRRRAAGVYAHFCAGNLADDIIDGEANYLADGVRLGPSVQFLLPHLATGLLLSAGVPADVLAEASFILVRGAATAQVENRRTTAWDLPTYCAVQEGAAGMQYAAFLAMLWAGTPIEPHARGVGRGLGIASRIVKDVGERKDRFWTMPPDERREAVRWGASLLDDLAPLDLRSVSFVSHAIRAKLVPAEVA